MHGSRSGLKHHYLIYRSQILNGKVMSVDSLQRVAWSQVFRSRSRWFRISESLWFISYSTWVQSHEPFTGPSAWNMLSHFDVIHIHWFLFSLLLFCCNCLPPFALYSCPVMTSLYGDFNFLVAGYLHMQWGDEYVLPLRLSLCDLWHQSGLKPMRGGVVRGLLISAFIYSSKKKGEQSPPN